MNPENVLAEFGRAKKALRAAQILRADGLLEDAIFSSSTTRACMCEGCLASGDV
jgi:hypothetical protein